MFQVCLTGAATALAVLYTVLWIFYPYFWKDASFWMRTKSFQRRMGALVCKGTNSVLCIFKEQAQKFPSRAFIIYEDRVYAYQDVDKRSSKVANVFLKEGGLKKGDVVALLMNNGPDYICLWLGLSKLGITVSMLNVNIRAKSLKHCLKICNAKALVAGADMSETLKEILPFLKENGIRTWTLQKDCNISDVHTLLDKLDGASDAPVPAHLSTVSSIMDSTLYLFTSGTTGLPKAAIICHRRALIIMHLLFQVGATKDEVVYVPLPRFHLTGLIGVGGCIVMGAACVVRKKFSVSQFWDDCRKYDVSMITYIGEVCRYLCSPPKITEIYRATEANGGFVNYTHTIGAIGRASFFNKLVCPFEFFKYDVVKDEVVRDENGRCIKLKKVEAGLLVIQVTKLNPFLGYAGDLEQTEKKLMRNCLEEGDVYFNSGDLLRVNKENFVYFCDRVGDAFRWKGENVSTTEVTEILGQVDFIQEANVFGVAVPGFEGRIGMAALVLKQQQAFDGKKVYDTVVDLPAYARPFFLRIQETMDITETFKHKKVHLRNEGFNPDTVSDPLYVLDNYSKSYEPMTKGIYEEIISGKLKL
ncbi:long-chain fatty acid transport protein 2-like [Amia ocellicauda]|uniref:long-chain fatty acid transport protein 2-like n=1 Tax=Amia ocellicauda TaxID=2972642 RepID=UPI003464D882